MCVVCVGVCVSRSIRVRNICGSVHERHTKGCVRSDMNLTWRANELASKGSWLTGIAGEVNWRQMLGASLSHLPFRCSLC